MQREPARRSPRNLEARVALARSLIAAGNLPRAEAEIAELLKGAPNAAVVHALNGTLQASRKNAAAARSSFERSLELTPGFLEALGGLTYLDLPAKNPAAAIARLDAEIVKQPTSAPLLVLLARAHSAAGDEAKAEQALRRAVSVDPRFTPGLHHAGATLCEARAARRSACRVRGHGKRNPSDIGARTMVGMLLESQGRRGRREKGIRGHRKRPRERSGRGKQSRVHLRRAGHQSRRRSSAGDVGEAAPSQ